MIRNHGYDINLSYIAPNLWKTNAPVSFMFDFVKAWRKHELTREGKDLFRNIEDGSPAFISFSKPVE